MGKITTIHETKDYLLQVGESVMMNNNKMRCYQIVNKNYDVIESETTNLYRAKSSIVELQGYLDESV